MKYASPAGRFLVLIITGLVLRLVLIPIHPIGSDDFYRYLWDGKVIANGINPYRYSPSDPALTGLHSQILPARVNFADMKTIYPPLAEILFYLAYRISGENFLGIKLLLFVFDIMTLFGIFMIVRKLNLSRKNILLYALCPLPLFQFFVDGHMDGFGLPLLVFGILFYITDKKLLSYFLIGLSICIKPLALIVIPIFVFSERGMLNRLKVVTVPIAVCVLLYLPFLFSGSPFQALITFTENWTFNGVVFDLLNSFLNDNQRTRAVCALLLLVLYAPIVLSRKELLTKIYLSVFLLMIFSPVVHPWYLSWLAILLPLHPRWSGIAFVSLISLTSFTLVTYQLTGVWKDYLAVLLFEYVPVLSMFLYEIAVPLPIVPRQ
ncbi:MAG TPA: glycosyltransferase 87 family protein [Candidatus Acidoferrales bacterium]|nr:glycosyltransferase 87 family protein [Candidatus Acidoferrales bacterium]